MIISPIFRFTLFEKTFQGLTTLLLILTIGRALSSEEFSNWSIGLGIYLTFLPLVALFPSEVIVRFMQNKNSKIVKVRMLLSSVIIRGLLATLVILIVSSIQIFQNKFNHNGIYISILLLCIAGFIETFGFLNVLALKTENYNKLIRNRFISTVIKLLLTLCLLFFSVNIYYLCFVFYIDSIILILFNLYLVSDYSTAYFTTLRRYASIISYKKIYFFCAKLFSTGVPLIFSLTLYNFILRSDRFFVAQMGSTELFKIQTITMQFLDPVTMLFIGYLINIYLTGANLPINKVKKLMCLLIFIGLIFSMFGDYVISFGPENIAHNSGYFKYYSWYIPAYGGFAILFWSVFYSKNNSLIIITIYPLLFLLISLIINYMLYLFANKNLSLAAPILAIIVSIFVMSGKCVNAKAKLRSI